MSDSTQEELAERLGKSQPFIANKIRLLNLCEPVQQAINNRQISERHGRAMLKLTADQQVKVLEKIIEKELTVKETEKLIERSFKEKQKKTDAKCFGISTRIAVNTIKKAVNSLKEVNVPVEMQESENEDTYTITINIKK